MQSSKGTKKTGFKCPSLAFSAPVKNKDESVIEKKMELKNKEDLGTGYCELSAADKKSAQVVSKVDTDRAYKADADISTIDKMEKCQTTRHGKLSKPKCNPLPVRNLTAEEYDEIFDAVMKNAESLDIDNWEPRVTSAARVKEPGKKKYSITVGKKSESKKRDMAEVKTERKTNQKKETSSNDKEEKHAETDVKSAEDFQMVAVEMEDDTLDDGANTDKAGEEGREADSVVNHNAADEPQPDIDSDSNPDEEMERSEDVQAENETTPLVSEVECNTQPVVQEKKKIKKKKVDKLLPKKLPFHGKSSDSSMVKEVIKKKEKKSEKMVKNTNKGELKQVRSGTSDKELQSQTEMDSSRLTHKRKKGKQQKANKRQKMLERELNLEDKAYNSCKKAEENYDESDHIYTKFTEGSVVWAKITGYPWWPAMVEMDPDAETYFSVETENSMYPTHYHVVFFDERVSRSWVKAEHVRSYSGNEEEDQILSSFSKKGQNYTREINAAKKNANRALKCTLEERVELFGFAARFTGVWQVKQNPTGNKKACRTSKSDPGLLDDSAVDDVLDNAEEILEQVEDLLESMHSSLLDSEEGSDFTPDVVEKKRKKGKQRTEWSETMPKVATLCKDDADENYSSTGHDLGPSERKCEEEEKKHELKLDLDIFTMELDNEGEEVFTELAKDCQNRDQQSTVDIEISKKETEQILGSVSQERKERQNYVLENDNNIDNKDRDTKPKKKKKCKEVHNETSLKKVKGNRVSTTSNSKLKEKNAGENMLKKPNQKRKPKPTERLNTSKKCHLSEVSDSKANNPNGRNKKADDENAGIKEFNLASPKKKKKTDIGGKEHTSTNTEHGKSQDTGNQDLNDKDTEKTKKKKKTKVMNKNSLVDESMDKTSLDNDKTAPKKSMTAVVEKTVTENEKGYGPGGKSETIQKTRKTKCFKAPLEKVHTENTEIILETLDKMSDVANKGTVETGNMDEETVKSEKCMLKKAIMENKKSYFEETNENSCEKIEDETEKEVSEENGLEGEEIPGVDENKEIDLVSANDVVDTGKDSDQVTPELQGLQPGKKILTRDSDSDDNFSLYDEQSMYEDEGEKIQERAVTVLSVPVVRLSDEESDPFDLMEE